MTESTIIMSFTDLLKKATNFLGIGSPETHRPPPLDGEIIFCKNNVCVHPPAALTNELEHYPGYLNIRSQDDKVCELSMLLCDCGHIYPFLTGSWVHADLDMDSKFNS